MVLSHSLAPIPALFVVASVFVYVYRLVQWRSRARGRPFPPGPPGLPLVGNVFNIPKSKQWVHYEALSAKYGDILHFRVLGSSIVVLGNAEVIMEYLDKRSANTSDRKQSILIELSGSDLNFGFMPYGPWWRRHRRGFWQHFRPQAITEFQKVQCAMVRKFLAKVLRKPSDFKAHMRYSFSAVLMKILYDIEMAEENDGVIEKVEKALQGASEGMVPGKYLVEVLPFLRYVPAFVPGVGFQKLFAEWRAAAEDLKHTPFEYVKDAIKRSSPVTCIIGSLLKRAYGSGVEQSMLAEEEEVVMNIGAVAFEAGSDTTFSSLQTVLLAMSLYPEVLKKAHAELDSVVGPGRLPNFEDAESLVYVNAIIKEALRWMPVLPLGVPHCTIEDDEFGGYFVPAGTVVMANVWSCMHDPSVYEDPKTFRPERFIQDGQLNSNVRDPSAFAFGFGRRICPGRYFAEAALFINVACALHVFDISAPLDEEGKPIKIVPEMTEGLLIYPEDCRCTIRPRSATATALILADEDLGSVLA
ncbi:CyP450 monooxygenase [Daedaleopsis nitida]|nr:CyP450 monooxygenase [Daedaleopsis nitida]